MTDTPNPVPVPVASVIHGITFKDVWGWMLNHKWSFALLPVVLLIGVAAILLSSLQPTAAQTVDQQAAEALRLKREAEAQAYKDAQAKAAKDAADAAKGITIVHPPAPPTKPVKPGKGVGEISDGFNNLGG